MAITTTLTLKFNGAAVEKGLQKAMKGVERLANAGFRAGKMLISPFAKLSAILGPAALVGGMFAFAKGASDAAANLENLQARFEIFTGSAEKAQQIIADLRKLAVESPLELSDLSEGANMLLTYGIAADRVIDITSRLSEVSAGNAQRFERLALAYGQAASIGRLMGTELRQFTEAGFNPLESIARKTGETMIQLKKRMEDGGISITEVEQSLKKATDAGGRFYGLNAKMSKTFTGQVAKMKDSWSQLSASFGTGMNEGLKMALDAVSNQIPQFMERFKQIGIYFGQAIGDAVAGDYSKFVAIGEFIGEAMGVGLETAWHIASRKLMEGTAKAISSLGIPVDKNSDAYKAGRKAAMSSPSVGELLEANITNSTLRQKAEAIQRGNQGLVPGTNGGFRYAQPGESSVFSDAQGNKVIQVLQSIDRRLQPQPGM